MRYEIEIPTLNEKILEVVAGQNFLHRSEFVRYGDNFLLHIKLLLLNNGNFRCYSLQKQPQMQQIAWKGISTQYLELSQILYLKLFLKTFLNLLHPHHLAQRALTEHCQTQNIRQINNYITIIRFFKSRSDEIMNENRCAKNLLKFVVIESRHVCLL